MRRILVGIALMIAGLPASASAQEAVLTGTVTDSSGAVLPGVAVTAVLQATGNTFETVTDEAGICSPAEAREYQRLIRGPGSAP